MSINCSVEPDHSIESCAKSELHILYNSLADYENTNIVQAIKLLVEEWLNTEDLPHFIGVIRQNLGLNDAEIKLACWLFALNPNTPPSVLQDLCTGAPVSLLERIAENKNVSSSTLALLARASAADVRIAAGSNSHASLSTIAHLVQDADSNVRFSLAENHNLSKKVLQFLSSDENPYVRCRAETTMARLATA
jgi:hypothetical protein